MWHWRLCTQYTLGYLLSVSWAICSSGPNNPGLCLKKAAIRRMITTGSVWSHGNQKPYLFVSVFLAKYTCTYFVESSSSSSNLLVWHSSLSFLCELWSPCHPNIHCYDTLHENNKRMDTGTYELSLTSFIGSSHLHMSVSQVLISVD